MPSQCTYNKKCPHNVVNSIFSDAQKMVEEKQKRIDDNRRAFQHLRTTCIVWPNSASVVLLAGSFDGWATQV